MPTWVRFWVTAAALLITVVLAVLAFNVPGDMAKNPYAKTVGLFWALGPPVWFFLDWYFYDGPLSGAEFDVFKLNQDRAKDLWAGVGVALLVLLGLKG